MAIIKRFHKKMVERKFFTKHKYMLEVIGLLIKVSIQKWKLFSGMNNKKKQLTNNPAALFKQETEVFFSDCFKKYVEEAFPLLKRSTQEAYESRFRYFKKGPLPHMKMSEFRAKSVCGWIDWLKQHKTAQNKGRKSFLKEVEILRTILSWYRNFVDEDFSVPITKKHRQLCHYKVVPPKRPDYYARPEELRDFISWLQEHRRNPVYWRLALFMILTGARVSEACGLCWDSVDLKRGIARVIRRIAWEQRTKRPYLEETTKTDASVRVLLLPDELIEVLQELKEEQERDNRGKNKVGLLFTDINQEALKYNAIQSSFNAGFEALDLNSYPKTFLRHSSFDGHEQYISCSGHLRTYFQSYD